MNTVDGVYFFKNASELCRLIERSALSVAHPGMDVSDTGLVGYRARCAIADASSLL